MASQRPKGRPSRGGANRHAQLYKIAAEAAQKKLVVLDHLAGSQMRATISHFYPNLASSAYNSKRATIYRWARSRASLEAALAEGKREHRKVRNVGVGTILSQASESEIAEWVKELRGDGIPVSSGLLPSPNCIASADPIVDLERLSLLEGPTVEEEQDFYR
ncbi:hypothetical protein GN244_ATG14066 [Phytophthora infestans]|uniref:HTH CENPB-type domain-containing protein n=1 Tax=Phytophthora infestans TaxID=4787 RepID=A0A833SWT0_PHYIN|nr:hypothetical protein GN244_ATG14066 [Phytophthora infestans]KAF4147510.1 hypothetical protein GN958_ATG03280 [Phytophthora infestans]